MNLPLLENKNYSSTLSTKEIKDILQDLKERETKYWIFKSKPYEIEYSENSFKIQKAYNSKSGPTHPAIEGEFITEFPTILKIQITPKYWKIFFFLIFPIVFVPTSIFSETMKINGELRQPEVWERLLFAGIGGIMPLIMCYFDSIKPIYDGRNWLIKKLKLTELP